MRERACRGNTRARLPGGRRVAALGRAAVSNEHRPTIPGWHRLAGARDCREGRRRAQRRPAVNARRKRGEHERDTHPGGRPHRRPAKCCVPVAPAREKRARARAAIVAQGTAPPGNKQRRHPRGRRRRWHGLMGRRRRRRLRAGLRGLLAVAVPHLRGEMARGIGDAGFFTFGVGTRPGDKGGDVGPQGTLFTKEAGDRLHKCTRRWRRRHRAVRLASSSGR